MKIPFLVLPRTVYDDGRRDLLAAHERIKELEQLLLDMKLDGAQIVRANPAYRKAHREKVVDPIDAAIAENPKCRMNPMLARGMRTWADQIIAEGEHDQDWILGRIRNWDRISTATSSDDEDEEDRRLGLIAS